MDLEIDLTYVLVSFSLSPIVLCTHVLALYLLKKDRSFGNIQKYLLVALCITEVFLVISLLIYGINRLYSWSGFEVACFFGETTVCLMYFCVMITITWDRYAEIKLNLKYPLYCNSKKTVTLLVIMFIISLSLFVILLPIQLTNGRWDYDLYLKIYVFPIFHGIFIISAVFVYCYIFKKVRKSQIAQLKIRRQLQLQMSSLNSRNKVNLKSKPKLFVPSLIVLTFLIFATLPHCLLLVCLFSGWNKVFNLIPLLYLFGWFVDPVIYVLSVKSIQQVFRRFLRFLK